MMMSKPAPAKQEEAPPAFAQPVAETTKKTPQSAVEDLERRLAMLGEDEQAAMKPLAVVAPPVAVAPAATHQQQAPMTGGKNALLARIMAAKEKSQQAQTKVAAPKQEPDLLMDFDAPTSEKDPPPSYNFLQPPALPTAAVEDAPPAFDAVENTVILQAFPPPPPIDAVVPPPPMVFTPMAPPAASAPSFESLMVNEEQQQQHHLAGMQAMAPPAIDEDILAALDPAERNALLEEQRQIMEQIEKNKANNEASSAAARAMSFNQRSNAAVANLAASIDGPARQLAPTTAPSSRPSPQTRSRPPSGNTVDLGHGETVPLHGQERTQQAIEDGTAVIVQCMSCQNWMQVTEAASLMFCPICQVVCPVEKTGAATSADMEAAAQMAADAQLAEELQKEEYERAGGSSERPRRRQQQAQPKTAGQEQSWYNWIVGSPAPAAAATTTTTTTRSAEVNNNNTSRSPRLVAARIGDETEGLIQRSGGGGARVADQKSMFACVADSVSAAAEQMTAYSLPLDQEGNVHGVDSSSLLAMPDVSREREM